MRRTAKAHDMDLPGTREGRYEAGGAPVTRTRNGTGPRIPRRLELPYPRPAFDVREGTIPLVLTSCSLVVSVS